MGSLKSFALVSVLLAAGVVVVPKPALGQTPTTTSSTPSFQDAIPSKALFEEEARISSLMYEVNSRNSTAIKLSETPLTLRYYLETSGGVEVAVIVGTKTKVIYVAFRGTDGEVRDTFVDALLFLVPISLPNLSGKSYGNVHGGFQQALREALPSLDSAVKSAMNKYPGYAVHAVGHSLGGALAHLYGFYAAKTYLSGRKVRVLNVGQPRVGDVKMSQSVDATKNLAVFRMVYEDDVVARVPLPEWGYSHAGHLLLIRNGRIRAYYRQSGGSGYAGVPRLDWIPAFLSDIVLSPFWFGSIIKAFLDHAPWNYNKAIRQAIEHGTFPTKFEK